MPRVINQQITLDRQCELISRLTRLAARRAEEGGQCARRHNERVAAARRLYGQLRSQTIAEFERAHAARIAEYKAAREKVLARYEAQGHALAKEEERFYAQAAQELRDWIAAAKTLRQHRTSGILRAYREQ